MTSVLCSQGHTNLPGSRFCHLCGEKLSHLPSQPINMALEGAEGIHANIFAGLILGDRYRVLRELGHGGFGRTYLAEDINRFDEACVLKEFAPQVQGTYALQKSEELFEREAGVLYKLRHPQIPRFRELFRANLGDRGYLFLVQDFVEGYTYRQLLEARRQTSLFSETEIIQLFEQLLPVLHYIHTNSVIHRDISPDNLILRSSDRLPVLIDFGGVKQVAAVAASQYMKSGDTLGEATIATRLGKVGYAPEEQMQSGFASPHSDLYALAMTAMVLLTGREPLELLSQPFYTWQQQFSLSSALADVLMKMLSPQSSDRFQSALEVLEALQSPALQASRPSHPDALTQAPSYTQPATFQPSPAQPSKSTVQSTEAFAYSSPAPLKRRGLLISLLLVAFLGGVGGWWMRDRWLPILQAILPGQNHVKPKKPGEIQPEQSKFSPEEQQRKQALQTRRQALGINQQFLVNLSNATFYAQHPDQQGRTLSDNATDAEWRGIWDSIANEWLNLLEQNVGTEARGKLGSYSSAERDQWKQEVNKLYVGSRSLFDLTDAKFFHLFPQMRGQEFIEQPIGQVWQAIAFDQVRAMQMGRTLTQLQFDPNSFSKQDSGTLSPGEGKIYTAQLTEGQILRVSLQAPPQGTLLSIYPPRPGQGTPFPEDAAEATWAGQLTQSGYYEFVVVANSVNAVSYQLNLAVDNVTSTPVKSPIPESPQAKD